MRRGNLYPLILCIFYFVALFLFYLVEYYVPDIWHYRLWAEKGAAAFNGYSSLFILISNIALYSPIFAHILSLVALSTALFLFLNYTLEYLEVTKHIGAFLVISSGIWFYFYGKIFYDFPFFMLTFAFALKILRYSQTSFLYWFLLGLALSWKLYFIFSILGICSLLVINKDYCRKIFHFEGLSFFTVGKLFIKKTQLKLAKYAGFTLLGFVIGNFRLLTEPLYVIREIFGREPGGSDFGLHIFQGKIIWDHVNSVSVSLGNYFIPSVVIIFFITPLFIKNKMYLISSIAINFAYYLFVIFKSPGYLWHSFSMGVYLILFGLFMLKESETCSNLRRRSVHGLMILAISMQLINNYVFYIPKQVSWHNTTKETITFLQKNAADIVSNIQKVRSSLDDESSYILDFRRDTFKAGMRKNILNEYVPDFSEGNETPWGVKTPYIVVVHVDKMDSEAMGMVYNKVFASPPLLREFFDGYTLSVYEKSSIFQAQ